MLVATFVGMKMPHTCLLLAAGVVAAVYVWGFRQEALIWTDFPKHNPTAMIRVDGAEIPSVQFSPQRDPRLRIDTRLTHTYGVRLARTQEVIEQMEVKLGAELKTEIRPSHDGWIVKLLYNYTRINGSFRDNNIEIESLIPITMSSHSAETLTLTRSERSAVFHTPEGPLFISLVSP